MANLLLLVLCLSAGFALRRLGRVDERAPTALVRVVLDLALPAFTFGAIRAYRPGAYGAHGALFALLSPWLVAAVVFASLSIVARARGWSRERFGAVAATSVAGNTAFLGLPLVEALAGREAVPAAVLLDQAGSFVIVSTATVAIAARASGKHASWRAVARRVLTFPPSWGAALGALSRGHAIPAWLESSLARMAALVVPLALVAVGMQLRVDRALLRREGAQVALALALKMLGAPALVLALGVALGVRGPALHACVLQNAMPPMVTAGVVAAEYGLAPELCAALVALGAVAALATVPAFEWALRALGY